MMNQDYGLWPQGMVGYGLQFNSLIQLLWHQILYGCVVWYRVADMRLPATSCCKCKWEGSHSSTTPLCEVTVPLRCLRPPRPDPLSVGRLQTSDLPPQILHSAKTDAAAKVTSQSVKQCRSGMHHHVGISLNTSFNLRDIITFFSPMLPSTPCRQTLLRFFSSPSLFRYSGLFDDCLLRRGGFHLGNNMANASFWRSPCRFPSLFRMHHPHTQSSCAGQCRFVSIFVLICMYLIA